MAPKSLSHIGPLVLHSPRRSCHGGLPSRRIGHIPSPAVVHNYIYIAAAIVPIAAVVIAPAFPFSFAIFAATIAEACLLGWHGCFVAVLPKLKRASYSRYLLATGVSCGRVSLGVPSPLTSADIMSCI